MSETAENKLPEPKTLKPEDPVKSKPILIPSKLSVNKKGELVAEKLVEVFPAQAYDKFGKSITPFQETGQNIDVRK